MRVEVVAFLMLFALFFGMAELAPWVIDGTGSTPLLIGAGVLLAIASNQPKRSSQSTTPPATQSKEPTPPSAPSPQHPLAKIAAPGRSPLPPRLTPPPPRSISFTIKKPDRASSSEEPR